MSDDTNKSRPTARLLPVAATSGRWHLVTLTAGGQTQSFALPASGDVSIGRGEDCLVRIDHETVSRRHAMLIVGEKLSIVDVGSANGTFVGNRRLKPGDHAKLSPGVLLGFGAVKAVVQAVPPSTRLRSVRSHDYFEARLEDECARTNATGGSFALCSVRVRPEATVTLEGVLAKNLRSMDVVALYAPDEYEFMLIDVDADGAEAMQAAIVRDMRAAGVDAKITVALFPRDARTPEELVALMHQPQSGEPSQPVTHPIVPRQSVLERMRPLIERVASSGISVLVVGETGVGKELLSRMIHDLSPRRSQPLLSINCATLQESLLESELFGHERGAFTGAVAAKPGLLEEASGGTVVLDEIGEMPLPVQSKLLRVFEQRQVVRVGAVKAIPIDVRFVAATNRDLEAEIHRGTFRQDLYFRLNGITLVLPPLRERLDEIEQLAHGMIAQACAHTGRETAPRISPEAMALMKRYAWPGNVRELRNVLERAVLLCTDDVIALSHLPVDRMGRVLPPPRQTLTRGRAVFDGHVRDTYVPPRMGSDTPPPFLSHDPASSPYLLEAAEEEPSERLYGLARGFDGNPDERRKIEEALARCGGNQSAAAKLLGVSRRTLVTRIGQYNLPRPRKARGPGEE